MHDASGGADKLNYVSSREVQGIVNSTKSKIITWKLDYM